MVDHPGLTIGLDGDLLFADSGNDLLRAYVLSSGHVINLAGSVVKDVPKAGFNGDGHWADSSAPPRTRARRYASPVGELPEIRYATCDGRDVAYQVVGSGAVPFVGLL